MLKSDYEAMFNGAIVSSEKFSEIENIAYEIRMNMSRYQDVGSMVQIPWYVIGAIHNLESSLNFSCHLHNGDPLTGRTINVPRGRPYSGEPPFTWEESAFDALGKSNLWRPSPASNWTVAQCLEFLERYNGLGYRAEGINTPYLWSMTNLYEKGLFVSDGKYNKDAVSQGVGAVALLKVMSQKGYIKLEF